MTRQKKVIEHYGIIPPVNSISFWEDNKAFDEDKVVFKIDLRTSLQKLTPTEKEIISLVNKGYSKREIAGMINLPGTTVQGIKERAIKKLREMMNGEVDIFEK